MNDQAPSTSPLPGLILRLAGLWIATGALFKLLAGTPADLPPVVRNLPLDLGLTYKLAIGIELGVVSLVMLRPRLAWPLVAGMMAVFDVILLGMLGDESCGCFGGSITVPPWAMLTVDSVFLLGILFTRPWSRLGTSSVPMAAAVVIAALGLALPWFFDRQVEGPVVAKTDGATTTLQPGDPEETSSGLKPWLELNLKEMEGKELSETAFANYVEVYNTPPDALWIVWRATCDHCAEHLEHLAQTEQGQRELVLLQLHEEQDTETNRVVHAMPTGDFVYTLEMPADVDYVITTPGELDVEGYVVQRGEEGVEVEGH